MFHQPEQVDSGGVVLGDLDADVGLASSIEVINCVDVANCVSVSYMIIKFR